jgi:hypothetical protein
MASGCIYIKGQRSAFFVLDVSQYQHILHVCTLHTETAGRLAQGFLKNRFRCQTNRGLKKLRKDLMDSRRSSMSRNPQSLQFGVCLGEYVWKLASALLKIRK